jgi:ADP-ribose pyrophosphatase
VEPELADEVFSAPVVSSEVEFVGRVWDVRRDRVDYGDTSITREYVDHPGAVAVLALDEDDRVLLIRQYRHPIGMRDWEIPAGLLDIDGESPVVAAKRELAEEVDLIAERWDLLSEFYTSPGGSNEAIRVYLARGLSATTLAYARTDEELDIEKRWVSLDDAVAAVLSRSLGNSILSIAVFAAHASRAAGWASLGDAASAWPRHPKLRDRA